MTKDETLKMALDFLMTRRMGAEAVIEALNEALAQPLQQAEPVAMQEKSCARCLHKPTWPNTSGVCGGCRFYSNFRATPPLPVQENK